jgi:hypothetical protein
MLVIVDDQPFPALGDNPGDAFTELEAHVAELLTGIVPGAWAQRVRLLVPEIDDALGCPQ